MKNKIVFITIILAIILVIWAVKPNAGQKNIEVNTDNATVSQIPVEISASDTGFIPSEITISEGTVVTFKNTSKDAYWPASDPHPSHVFYQEFDPKKIIMPGESWSFTFDKVGSWRFHNHQNLNHRGIINVISKDRSKESDVQNKKESSPSNPKCEESSTDFNCYEEYYNKLVVKDGITAGFADLKERYAVNSYVRSQCHPLTHVLGHAAIELYPEVSEAFTHGDSFCWSGYYHGVMEGIVEDIGKDKILSELNTICANIPGKSTYSFFYYNCVHGLGHGLMAISDNELMDALEVCGTLTPQWEKSACYGGAFMENVIVDNKNHFTKYLKPDDPLYPCNAVEDQYKGVCYLMQTSYILKVVNGDFSKVFVLCRQADKGYENNCFQSLGRDVSGQSLSNAEKTKTNCDLGADYNEKSNCIIGAVKDFISYYHSDVEARHLCSILSSDLRQICLDTAVSYYSSF